VTPSVSIKSDTCGADRRRDPTPKHSADCAPQERRSSLDPIVRQGRAPLPGIDGPLGRNEARPRGWPVLHARLARPDRQGPPALGDAGGGLDFVKKKTKKVIRTAGLRDELSFTSFRHGGLTELGDADLTDTQIRALSRQKSTKVLPRYIKRTRRQIVAGTVKRRALREAEGDD
jgi:hypothetical protein